MPQIQKYPSFVPYRLQHFDIQTLEITSRALSQNPLQDPRTRFNPLLVPKTEGPYPVVFVLAGFTGNAPFYLNAKFGEANFVQTLDQAVSRGSAPEALYVFVDALTSWGGSQFINSPASGRYEDYIIKELVPALKSEFDCSSQTQDWAVMGGSSGGYGALHLGSAHPDIFGHIGAIAPDSFFEASLLPDIYQALPLWEQYKGHSPAAFADLKNGKLRKQKNWHSLLNAFGMASCYGGNADGSFSLPVDSFSGKILADKWSQWKQHDPLEFLEKRRQQVAKLSSVCLFVGQKDNFHLQLGSRQIYGLLQNISGPALRYEEFDGTHFDIGEYRIHVWEWLASQFRC